MNQVATPPLRRLFRAFLRCVAPVALVAGCTTENPAWQPPEDACPADQTYYLQEYLLANPDRVDLLFVIDSGEGSLVAQQALARAMPALVQRLNATNGLDWQLAVTSMDASNDRGGLLTGVAGQAGCPGDRPALLRRATPEAGVVAACNVVLGEGGDRFPQAFRTARLAIEDTRNGFSREDARLVVVFVSHRDDCTVGDGFDRSDPANCVQQADRLFSLRDFQNYYAGRTPRNRDGNPVSIVAITGPPAATPSLQPVCTGVSGARAGNRFAALTEFGRLARHSLLLNICVSDFLPFVDPIVQTAIQPSDNALCPSFALAGAPRGALLRESAALLPAAELSTFGDLLLPGPTEFCPNGEVAVSNDALRGDVPRRVELLYCSRDQ
jgi:hypothetical protein